MERERVWGYLLLGAIAIGVLETGTIHQQLANRVEEQEFFYGNLFQTKGTLHFSLQNVTYAVVGIICTHL